jgi:hypothetical protein
VAFASKTLSEHFVRGAVGFGGLATALSIMAPHPWLAILIMPIAIWMFRGCPICWTTGLIEMIAMRLLRRFDPDRKLIARQKQASADARAELD